ncbi:MAG: PAS domain S-box protein [Rubrobacter sp.]
MRVLIVEDSEEDALLLLRELRRGGYDSVSTRVYTADDMRRALDRETWDIVVCDHSMPTFDSSAALEVLHERGYLDIPFMIVSGNIGEEAAVAAMRLGAHDYFMKDNLARLNTAIDRELREAENRRERRRAREDLSRSEERYRTFVAQSTEGIWRAEMEKPLDIRLSPDEQLELLYERIYFAEANDTMARMYGYERGEELVGTRLESFMPRDDPWSRAFLLDGFENGYRITDAESREVDRWGETRYFLNNFVGIVEAGHLVRIWGTQRDVTERKQAEKAILEAEEKYRGIFENSLEGIYQTTAAGRLLTANPAMARIFGYSSAEEMVREVTNVGETLYADPADRERVTGEVSKHGEVSGYEVEMARRDGSTVWVSLTGRAVTDEAGEFSGFEGTVEDISARKTAEEARRESEAIYRSVVENASESIFVVEAGSQKILEANDALCRSLGYSYEDLTRMTFRDLIAEDGEELQDGLHRILNRGSSHLGETKFHRKDGTLAEVEVGASVIPYGGGEAICIVSHDISDRRRVERALGEIREAERRRISRDLHDGALQDLAYALSSMQIERRIHGGRWEEGGQINSLKRAVSGIRSAIYDLRLEGPEEQTFTRSLESIIELNRQMNRDCDITLEVSEDFPGDLSGPRAVEVVRIIQEALTNARKHSGARNCRVSLVLQGGEMIATVSDDGVGFSAGSPVGVGLGSMRERAGALGGVILIESDAGTTVTLKIGMNALRGEADELHGLAAD